MDSIELAYIFAMGLAFLAIVICLYSIFFFFNVMRETHYSEKRKHTLHIVK